MTVANGANGKPTVHKYKRPQPPTFATLSDARRYCLRRLAQTCRIMHDQGWGVGCSMQLSARNPENSSTCFVHPIGRPLKLMKAEDLIEIRIADGSVVTEGCYGGHYDAFGYDVQRAIYQVRSDLGGIILGSTPYGRAFASQDRELKMILQDSCTFYKRMERLSMHDALHAGEAPVTVQEAIGQGKGFIIGNFGILVGGANIECPVGYFIRLQSLCQIQLMAEAAVRGRGGEMKIIGDDEVQFTYDNNGSEPHAWLHSQPYFQRQDAVSDDPL